MSAVSSGMELI